MRDQTTTIEQSNDLLAWGIQEEKASMVYVNNADLPTFREEIDLADLVESGHEYTPAFTVADLLRLFPPQIRIDNVLLPSYKFFKLPDSGSTEFQFQIRREDYERPLEPWRVGYISVGNTITDGLYANTVVGDNLVDLLCNRIDWLLTNGYNLWR